MRFDTASLQFTLIQLRKTNVSLLEAGSQAIEAAGEELFKAIKESVGMRDHSLTDLAILDHPYARRHGRIRIHTDAPWQVHRRPSPLNPKHRNQTDTLYEATTGHYSVVGGVPMYTVEIDTNKAPHALLVTAGTKVMLARDPLWRTANDEAVRKAMMVAVVRQLGKTMRSHIGVRFGAGTPTSTATSSSAWGGGSTGIR